MINVIFRDSELSLGCNNTLLFSLVEGTGYFLVTSNTSSLQMLALVKCNGMLSTKKRLVALTLKMVSAWSEVFVHTCEMDSSSL